jgi:hypothetical protein
MIGVCQSTIRVATCSSGLARKLFFCATLARHDRVTAALDKLQIDPKQRSHSLPMDIGTTINIPTDRML